ASERGLHRLAVHAFTDGRDTSPTSGISCVPDLDRHLRELGAGRVVSVCGRYYAMDRDKRWDRTRLAYELITAGVGRPALTVEESIQRSYDEGVTDEFLTPAVIDEPVPLKAGDVFIFANFRSDRC